MTSQQIKHVEEQLIAVFDRVVTSVQKNATSAETLKVIPEIAFALARLHEL